MRDQNNFLGANYTPVNTSSSSISYIDKYQKGISIIHYTNSCISNFLWGNVPY